MKIISKAVFAAMIMSSSLGFSFSRNIDVSSLMRSNLLVSPVSLARMFSGFKVGDTLYLDLTIKELQMKGTVVMAVTAVASPNVTITEDVSAGGQKENVVEVVNTATGKIVSYTVNGQAQTPPDIATTIISQDQTKVTVPAGTFDCIHLVVQDAQKNQSEVWLDPRDVPVAGLLQEIGKQQGFTIELQLTKFVQGS